MIHIILVIINHYVSNSNHNINSNNIMIRYNPRPIFYTTLMNASPPTLELTIRVPGFYSIKCTSQHSGRLYEKYANITISGTVLSIGYCMYVCINKLQLYIYIYIYIYIQNVINNYIYIF